MTYDSQIAFTLDTICPWTYLAKKRLDEALRRFRQSDQGKEVNFTVKYYPYQLYPEATKEGEDKYEWYKKSRYGNSEEKMKMYMALMTAYGQTAGIDFKFGGTVGNTMDAHRVVQHFQEEKGPEVADKIIQSLYAQYFQQEKHPSTDETLLKATTEAGIPEDEARAFIEDKNDGLIDVKNLVREQTGNGVDSVPTIIFEGKRRDITLVGAKEVEEYEKTLAAIVKESK
ncbi:hypothetical protein LTR84_008752 [Exophiala bonariae]|uniref:DSBA-like thioredoxin domain-containing protein n=1 Tax=Exophiala bonariae TaxID=1690606 RepID=A0AAV9MZE7_9EURO|nr:hypothetical protein LTR84_008752 [Exophiala bonariae]